ncbi:MAG TPA: DUF5681 domain-containing protein [Oceanobacillus sp.]|nr:DUF5681 domain-containing protein [Oceanobacillus sp.]
MSKMTTNSGRWQPGQSGNPKGRRKQGGELAEMLRVKGEEIFTIGGEEITAKEAVAKAIWQFAMTGEVWLAGKHMVAQNVYEWASVVKWLYAHLDTMRKPEAESEPELIVRVVREDLGERI